MHQQPHHKPAADGRAQDMPLGKSGRDRIDILNAGAQRDRLRQAEDLAECDRAAATADADQRGEDSQDHLFVFDQTAEPSQQRFQRLNAHSCAMRVAEEVLTLAPSRLARRADLRRG